MNYPTVSESLALLEKHPQIAAEFDAATPGQSRREAVEATLEAIAAKRRENLALKEKLAAAKTKLAALEKANAAQAKVKTELSTVRAKLIVAQSKANRRPAVKATANATPNRFTGAPLHVIKQAAQHACSPAADKAQAKAELERQGYTVTPEGIISHSIRGGRSARLASKKV